MPKRSPTILHQLRTRRFMETVTAVSRKVVLVECILEAVSAEAFLAEDSEAVDAVFLTHPGGSVTVAESRVI